MSSGHSHTVSVPAWWQFPDERCVVAATEAAGWGATGVTACDGESETEVCCGPQAATMIAAANKAARHQWLL